MQIDNFKYCYPINNHDRKENETFIYRNQLTIGKNWEEMYSIKTLHLIYKTLLETPDLEILGYRKKNNKNELEKKFSFLKIHEVFEKAEAIGSGLINMNLVDESRDWKNINFKFIGMYSINTVNYIISDIANCIYGNTIVPLYDTLGEEALNFVFNQTNLKTVFISSKNVVKLLEKKKLKNWFPSLKTLIILDAENFDFEVKSRYLEVVDIYLLEEIIKEGEKNLRPWAKISPNTIYAFSYTSGTTGDPKGAMLSHLNICSAINGCLMNSPSFDNNDSYLSYLPMAHVMERVILNRSFLSKIKIGVFSGDVNRLLEDVQILKPSIFISVPRLFNRIYDPVNQKINTLTGLKKSLILKAFKTKLSNLQKKKILHHWFYDKLVFNKFRQILGGRIKMLGTGSAPIETKVMNFFKVTFSCPFGEGYGQRKWTCRRTFSLYRI
jgi:long-chain acyl-CoA synthetase